MSLRAMSEAFSVSVKQTDKTEMSITLREEICRVGRSLFVELQPPRLAISVCA
jgi:hypothetical protein